MTDNVQVAVRVRPLAQQEINKGECMHVTMVADDPPQLSVNRTVNFSFNHIFMPDVGQADVYEATTRNLIDKLMEGEFWTEKSDR